MTVMDVEVTCAMMSDVEVERELECISLKVWIRNYSNGNNQKVQEDVFVIEPQSKLSIPFSNHPYIPHT